MKNRLCFFVLYDSEGIVDEYISCILSQLKGIGIRIIAVCNFLKINKGIEYVAPFVDEIIYRDNKGFDIGAYKDLLLKFGWDYVYEFDELWLLNDTFYGFFFDLKNTIKLMDNEDCDYWGMTRSPKGVLDNGIEYKEHIQSYFLVLNKKIFTEKHFVKYIQNLDYPATVIQAIETFELGLNDLLCNLNFRGKALSDLSMGWPLLEENINPYLKYPDKLIKLYNVPVLKKKSIDFRNPYMINSLHALEYIKNYCKFDLSIVKKNLKRISKKSEGMIDVDKLEDFYKKYNRIYIYGAGNYGNNVSIYFKYRNWKFENYIVTDENFKSENAITLNQLKVDKDTGIIIAIGDKDRFAEMFSEALKKCDYSQLICPNYIL